MGKQTRIRIGTRGSELAIWQAKRVQALIQESDTSIDTEIVTIKTSGDVNLSQSISEIGGKGIFLKEIEHALLNNDIDIAVHSFKDITSIPNKDLTYSGFLLEESVTDAFILFEKDLFSSPLTIATGSLRRKALCKSLYPNITCVDIRGNIQTRLKTAKERGYDGLMLSLAGLERLGLNHLVTHECNPLEFIPAPGQGIIAIQQRANERSIQSIIQDVTQSDINQLARNYYKLLEGVNFNCDIPFGAYFSEDRNLHIFLEKGNEINYFEFKKNEGDPLSRAIDMVRR